MKANYNNGHYSINLKFSELSKNSLEAGLIDENTRQPTGDKVFVEMSSRDYTYWVGNEVHVGLSPQTRLILDMDKKVVGNKDGQQVFAIRLDR